MFDKQKQLNYFWRGEEMTPPTGLISPFGLDWGVHHGRLPGCHPSRPLSLILGRRGARPVFREQEQQIQGDGCLETPLAVKKANHSNPKLEWEAASPAVWA